MSSPPLSHDAPKGFTQGAHPDENVLEKDVSLSDSLIWRRQKEFYVQRGLKAWTEDMVPNFLTNNPLIASIYARVVFGFILDCMKLEWEESRTEAAWVTMRILELGAGTGKFCFLFLRHLMTLLRSERLPIGTMRYCMTDCSEELAQEWRKSPYLSEFVDSGILEFSVLRDGESIPAGFLQREPVNGPLVVIANYVFDSLPQDAFVIQQGRISEAVATTAGNEDAKALTKLQISYKNVSISPNRYPDPRWNEILERYRLRFAAATVPFPSHALKVLQQIRRLALGTVLIMAGDKGFAHEDVLELSQGTPTVDFHAPNCFSQMVNFDAIAKYFEATGGIALLPDKHFGSLSICAFIAAQPRDEFPATQAAYRKIQQAFGPDDLFALMAGLNAYLDNMAVPQILALLRLGAWDPITLIRLFPALARQIRTVTGERHDLRNAAIRTFANHYPVQPGENVIAFYCGVILLELRFYEDALSMFRASQQILGPSAPTSFNLGMCYEGLCQFPQALDCMIEACSLDAAFEAARDARVRLETKLSSKAKSEL